MNFAHEDQRFKDAVNAYVHTRLGQLNKTCDGLREIDPGYCDRHSDAVIYDVWSRCLTEHDHDEIKTHCCELATVAEIQHELRKYYDQQRDDEMEAQIMMLINEKQQCLA